MEATAETPNLDEGAFRRASDAAVVQALASDDIEAIARTVIQEYLTAIEESTEAGTMTVKASQPQPPEFLQLEAKPLAELSPEEAFKRGFRNGQASLRSRCGHPGLALQVGPQLLRRAALQRRYREAARCRADPVLPGHAGP